MSAGRSQSSTLHRDQSDHSRLVWALVISIVLHGGGYGLYEGGKKYQLWEKIQLPRWIQKLTQALIPPPPKQPPPRDPPMMFVEVNPASAASEPPKDARYYAAQSTRASNPDPGDTDIPKISGAQERVTRTEDTQLSKAQPLQPAPPTPKPAEEEARPKPALRPGDLTVAKPEAEPRKTEGETPKPKPKTVAEAKARQQRLSAANERSKQDGGVRQRNLSSTLDAVGSPFGVYDAAIVAAIQERWYGLLEQRNYASDKTGKVVLEFRLNYDGRVTDMKVVENTVDEILCLLCQKAILDPAPFARWPSDMRRMANADYRDVRFTFYYN